jgi:hypothetical protein
LCKAPANVNPAVPICKALSTIPPNLLAAPDLLFPLGSVFDAPAVIKSLPDGAFFITASPGFNFGGFGGRTLNAPVKGITLPGIPLSDGLSYQSSVSNPFENFGRDIFEFFIRFLVAKGVNSMMFYI